MCILRERPPSVTLTREQYHQLLSHHEDDRREMPTTSDFVHFKIIPSIGKRPIVYTLIVYQPNSLSGTVSAYSSLSDALAAAALVPLPDDQIATLVQTNPVTGDETAGTKPGGVTEGGVNPGGPVGSPVNPASSNS